MCGICGAIGRDFDAVSTKAIVQNMTDKLVHRGPDNGAVLQRNDVTFGFR